MGLVFYGVPWEGTARVRGRQIASALGVPFNPETYSDEDVGVFVKRIPFVPIRGYVDIVDNRSLIGPLDRRQHIPVITLTEAASDHLRRLIPNKTIVIPQQHCNNKNVVRAGGPVQNVGFCGGPHSFRADMDEVSRTLDEMGLTFLSLINPNGRQSIIEFYRNLDIQIVYRPYSEWERHRYLKDSLKLKNAGSFGVPTVALREYGFDAEFKGGYIPVESLDDLFKECKRLATDRELYQEMSGKALEISQRYHIDKILPLYRELV